MTDDMKLTDEELKAFDNYAQAVKNVGKAFEEMFPKQAAILFIHLLLRTAIETIIEQKGTEPCETSLK